MSTPPLARLALGSSLVWMVVGSALGALALVAKASGGWSWAWAGLPAHQALVTHGWIGLLAMGGAYLYLPKRGRERPREALARAAVVIQHATMLAAALGWSEAARWAQLIAALCFAAHAWPRIKAFGS